MLNWEYWVGNDPPQMWKTEQGLALGWGWGAGPGSAQRMDCSLCVCVCLQLGAVPTLGWGVSDTLTDKSLPPEPGSWRM